MCFICPLKWGTFAFVTFILLRHTATVNPWVCQKQGSRLSEGAADLSPPRETALVFGALLLFFKRHTMWKGHCGCNWALVAVAFLFHFLSFSFFLYCICSLSLPRISHLGPLGTHGRWSLAQRSMAWALSRCTDPCRARTPQYSWWSKTVMARYATSCTKYMFTVYLT